VIVVDASAIADLLLDLEPRSSWVSRMLFTGAPIHAPHHLDVEVLAALRRLVLRGEVDSWRADRATGDLSELPIVRYPFRHLNDRVWSLRHNMTPYDAAYVALAEVLHAPLITTDRALARSSGHRARVETLSDE